MIGGYDMCNGDKKKSKPPILKCGMCDSDLEVFIIKDRFCMFTVRCNKCQHEYDCFDLEDYVNENKKE
jgi:hypothetical protein